MTDLGIGRGIPPCLFCGTQVYHLEKQPPYTAIYCSACRRVRDDLWYDQEEHVVTTERPIPKVRCYQINDQWEWRAWRTLKWFEASMEAFADQAPSTDPEDYDYVQVVPIRSYRAWRCGNDGAQGFRHRETGWTIPDHCRQSGGCPEMWHRSRRWQREIASNSPILDGYICEWGGER